MDTITEIKQTKKIVIDVLRHNVRARNDDKYLTFRVLQRILSKDEASQLLSISLTDLARLPAFETIKRIRARIQNDEGMFLPTSAEVRRKRGIREEVFRAWTAGRQGGLF